MKNQHSLLIALVAFLTLTGSLETKAQTKVWSIGPEAGVSLSKYGTEASNNEFKNGAVAGMFVTYSILNTYGVTGKVLFYQKGASFGSSDTRQTLNYIEVPIVGRFFFNKEGNVRPNIFVGPYLSLLTNATNKTGSNDPENIGSYKDYYNPVDLGVTTGLGCNFRIYKETYLVLDARYSQGITDFSKNDGNYITNQSFAFTGGISFGI